MQRNGCFKLPKWYQIKHLNRIRVSFSHNIKLRISKRATFQNPRKIRQIVGKTKRKEKADLDVNMKRPRHP